MRQGTGGHSTFSQCPHPHPIKFLDSFKFAEPFWQHPLKGPKVWANTFFPPPLPPNKESPVHKQYERYIIIWDAAMAHCKLICVLLHLKKYSHYRKSTKTYDCNWALYSRWLALYNEICFLYQSIGEYCLQLLPVISIRFPLIKLCYWKASMVPYAIKGWKQVGLSSFFGNFQIFQAFLRGNFLARVVAFNVKLESFVTWFQ